MARVWLITGGARGLGRAQAESVSEAGGNGTLINTVTLIARLLLGLMFLVFGSNNMFGFFDPGLQLSGTASQFVEALGQSHVMWVVGAIQMAGGVLLLVNRFVPLGLVLLGPVIVNILLFHAFMSPRGMEPGILASVLWLIVFYRNRQHFSGVFAPHT